MLERQNQKTPKTESSDQMFRKALEHTHNIFDQGFDEIPEGFQFKSSLPGVDSISMVSSDPNSAYVMLWYRSSTNNERHTTLTLTKKGIIGFQAAVRRDLKHLTEAQVLEEVNTLAQKVGVGFWLKDGVDYEIFPPGTIEYGDKQVSPKKKEEKLPDPDRLEFIRTRGALFGFTSNKNGGLKKYGIFVFPTFLIAEKPEYGNAVFLIDLKESIHDSSKILDKNDKNKLAKSFEELLSPSKQELVNMGARRVVHKTIDEKTWRERVQYECDLRK